MFDLLNYFSIHASKMQDAINFFAIGQSRHSVILKKEIGDCIVRFQVKFIKPSIAIAYLLKNIIRHPTMTE
jgi:hypothetical protein